MKLPSWLKSWRRNPRLDLVSIAREGGVEPTPAVLSKLERAAHGALSDALGVPGSVEAALPGWGEPPRTIKYYTMYDLQRALDFAQYGETYWLFGMYRDLLADNLHHRSEVAKRLIAVLGKSMTIQPQDPANEEDRVAAAVCESMVAHCQNWMQSCLHLGMGTTFPNAVCEKIYEPVPPEEAGDWPYPVMFKLKKLYPVKYCLLCYRIAYIPLETSSDFSHVPLGDPQQSHPVVPGSYPGKTPKRVTAADVGRNPALAWNANDWEPDIRFWNVRPSGLIDWNYYDVYKPDPARHVIHRGNVACQSERDTWGGDFRPTVMPSLLMLLGRDWWSQFMNRFGTPFIVGHCNLADKDLVNLLTKTFNKAVTVAGGSLIVNREAVIEMVQAQVAGAADGWKIYHQWLADQITSGILGHVMATTAKNTGLGSGVAGIATDVKEEWRTLDEQNFQPTFRDQIFHPFLRINGYRGHVRVGWGGMSISGMVELSKALQQFRAAGIKPTDAALQQLGERVGFELEAAELLTQGDGGNKGENND